METKPRLFLAAALLSGLSAAPASAALLLYEGFDYTASQALSSVTPNGSTTGLATSGTGSSYANGSGTYAPSGITTVATGLTFGSLSTSGGSVLTGTGIYVASAPITSTTSSDVIWGSYLVNLSGTSTGGANGMEIRLNASSTSSSTTPFFRSNAEARFSGLTHPAVAYDTTLSTTSATTLTTGTTYYIVSKFDSTNLNDSGGSATLWALNSDQFEAFVTAGRTEAHLNGMGNVTTSATVTSATATQAWNTVGTPVYLEYVIAGINVSFDEVRYGETLLDVSPIPEPSTALLGLVGAALLLRRRV